MAQGADKARAAGAAGRRAPLVTRRPGRYVSALARPMRGTPEDCPQGIPAFRTLGA
jgi:hypothetical protein